MDLASTSDTFYITVHLYPANFNLKSYGSQAFAVSALYSGTACTKTRNTEMKPPKRNHRNRRNRRNHWNTETKPPKPPKHWNETTKTPIKTWTKRSEQPQWHYRYWIPRGLSWIIISRILTFDFPVSVLLLSQSLQFLKARTKSENKRFFYYFPSQLKLNYVTQCKVFSHEYTAAIKYGIGHGRLADSLESASRKNTLHCMT